MRAQLVSDRKSLLQYDKIAELAVESHSPSEISGAVAVTPPEELVVWDIRRSDRSGMRMNGKSDKYGQRNRYKKSYEYHRINPFTVPRVEQSTS